MSNFNNKYQELIKCIEKNVKDQKELEIIKKKIDELFLYNSVNEENSSKIKRLEDEIQLIKERLNSIEEDIYINLDEDELESDQMHDNDFEFEIVCPYCEHEFVTDSSYKNATQIRCPKCKKIIELDWDINDECGGNCLSCENACYPEEDKKEEKHAVKEDEQKYSINIKEPKEEEKKQQNKENNDNNDDDM